MDIREHSEGVVRVGALVLRSAINQRDPSIIIIGGGRRRSRVATCLTQVADIVSQSAVTDTVSYRRDTHA